MERKFLFVAKSANKKTGAIAQTYTDKGSCPERCPFKNGNGCYCENFHTQLAWSRCHLSTDMLAQKVAENTAEGALIRHNVGGDMAVSGTSKLDTGLVKRLTEAFSGRRAYTYTHCTITAETAEAINQAKAKGFLINASCETLAEVLNAKKHGVNACLTVPKLTDEVKAKYKAQGVAVTLCPAQLKDGITCDSCRVCAKDRQAVIAFEIHGSRSRKATEAVINRNN